MLTSPASSEPLKCLAAAASARPLSPSLGGWQAFETATLSIYELAACIYNNDDDLEKAGRISDDLVRTPLWHRLTFVCPSLEQGDPAAGEALGHVLSEIRDPRWFVDPEKSDSLAKLYTRLGLGNYATKEQAQNRAAIDALCVPPPGTHRNELRHPRRFLWRAYATYASEFEPARAALQTGRVFVKFLQGVWLHWLYETTPWVGEPLFVPAYYFSDVFNASKHAAYVSELAASYRRYAAAE